MPTLNNYVTSGAMIGFKTGLQATIDTMLAVGSDAGASHGTFYLAQDTHRLYVGNEDTSLSAVNEGIVTVSSINELPRYTGYTPAQRKLLAGQFYYITGNTDGAESNILCVYNGQRWVQINQMPEVATIASYQFEVEGTTGSEVLKGTIQDSLLNAASGRFRVTGDDGVVITYGSTNVTINGVQQTVPTINVSSKYELEAYTSGTGANTVVGLELNSEDGTNDTQVVFKPKADGAGNTNVSFGVGTNGELEVTVKDSQNQSVAVTGNSTAGFDVTITDNFLETVTTNFQPKIKYGTGTSQTTVDFVSGTATLNTYTKDQIDGLMTGLNAMTYIGKYNTPSSGQATAVDTIGGSGTCSLGGTNVPMHVGDTILVDATFSLPAGVSSTGSAVNVQKGSLLIARGTEDANGQITASTLKFDVVAATKDTDTTYTFQETTGGVILRDSGLNAQGALIVTGGNDASGTATDDMIKVTHAYDTTNMGNGKQDTVTIKHKDVTRTNSTATAVTQSTALPSNTWSAETTITVITGVTTNTSGHVTGVETTSVKLKDTATYFPATGGFTVTSAAHSGTNDKSVGVFTNTVTLTSAALETTSATSYNAITSKTLTISDDDTQKISASSSQGVSGLNIEMLWGSF